MKHKSDGKLNLGRWLAVAALSLPLLAIGCTPDDSAVTTDWKVTSNVADWRDEVVYQLLVDRFADGDVNNDVSINPSALGRFQGGDWQGVIDHIDYLKALGVTAVWVSPVVRNVDTDANFDSYHGYWAQDLTHTDPHFGDLVALRQMVLALHANHIKVILDIVANHLGQLFYYDINENGSPDDDVFGEGCPPEQLNNGCGTPGNPPIQITHLTEYDPDYDPNGIQAYTSLGFSGPAPVRWLYIPEIHRMPPQPPEFQNLDWYNKRGAIVDYTNYNHQPSAQVITGDFPGGLKDLKTIDPDVQTALISAYTYWIGAADFDAFRIDTIKHVEHIFWQKFAPAVRSYAKAAGKNNFWMFGEAFDGDDQLVGSFTFNNELDSTVYFPQKYTAVDGVFKNNDPTQNIQDLWSAQATDYDPTPHTNGPVDENGTGIAATSLMVNFLDNHDVPRFDFDKPCVAPDNCPAQWNALSFIFTEQGVPCVYYGTEQEFNGGNDPTNRERLWDTGFPTTGKTFQHIRALSDLRRKFRPLRHGATQVRWATTRVATEDDAGIFAFERVDAADGKRVLVVLNVEDAKSSITQAPAADGGARMVVGWAPGTQLTEVLADPATGVVASEMITVAADSTVAITVPARGAKVFVAVGDAAGIAPLD